MVPRGANEPSQEIMALFVPRKLFLQTRMRSNPVGLDFRFLVGPFVCFHTLCVQSAKALAMRRFARVFVIPSHELAQMKMYKVYTIRHKQKGKHPPCPSQTISSKCWTGQFTKKDIEEYPAALLPCFSCR